MTDNYQTNQNFNYITRFLHANRHKNLTSIVMQIAETWNGKLRVVDIGCGQASAYEVIKKTDVDFDYIGIELREDFAQIARMQFGQFENFEIICDSVANVFDVTKDADLIIALESFEHIPEPVVVRTVEAICQNRFRCLFVTVPNELGPAVIIKNVGAFLINYSRYKEYTWSETLAAGLCNLDSVERHGIGHKGFDWRWLAQTIRQNCTIVRMTKSPFDFIPRFMSPSIGFVCESDADLNR